MFTPDDLYIGPNFTDACLVPLGGAVLFVTCITLAYFIQPWGAISFLICVPYFFFWQRRIEMQRVAQREANREAWMLANQMQNGEPEWAPASTTPPLSATAVVTGPATPAQNPNFPTAVVVTDTPNVNGWETSQRQAMDKASRA